MMYVNICSQLLTAPEKDLYLGNQGVKIGFELPKIFSGVGL